MKLRPWQREDSAALREILAKSGLSYAFPDLEDWRFNPVLILEDDAGRIAMGAGLHLTSEAYLWVNRESGSPAQRWEWLQTMQEAVRRKAQELGYADVHAFVPPELRRAFERRLRQLGWTPERFACWWRSTG